MTAEEEFFTKLVALAKLVGGNFELTKEVTRLYDQHLAPLGYEKICRALDQIIVNRCSRDPFPSIKEIRLIACPEIDAESEAILIASKIIGAVCRIGPYQVSAAKDYIGSIGWAVVESEGGWENVCTVLTNDNLGMLRAQWRNLAKTFLDRSLLGLSLPSPNKRSELRSFGNLPIAARAPMTEQELVKKADAAREFLEAELAKEQKS